MIDDLTNDQLKTLVKNEPVKAFRMLREHSVGNAFYEDGEPVSDLLDELTEGPVGMFIVHTKSGDLFLKVVESVGGIEGGGDHAHIVFIIKRNDEVVGHLKLNGFYSSYDGTEWDPDDVSSVEEVKVIRTEYLNAFEIEIERGKDTIV